ELSLDELEPYLKYIDEVSARRIRFTILMNESTREAIEIIKRGSKSLNQELGEIVNYQHKLLRDLYEVSLPQLEKIRDAMLDAGAYGVKISGAGMGGSLVAITPFEEEVKENIVKAALKAGASKGWRVRIDEGVRLEKITI
ncbi:MAG: GHMP kinase, partial [Thermoprotei archaeon]